MLLEPPIDTLPRYRGSVAKRAWHPSLDWGRMHSLTGGVCIKLLIKLRHNQKEPTNPTLVPHAANNRDPATETELKGSWRVDWKCPALSLAATRLPSRIGSLLHWQAAKALPYGAR
jgi:hypothetical protein